MPGTSTRSSSNKWKVGRDFLVKWNQDLVVYFAHEFLLYTKSPLEFLFRLREAVGKEHFSKLCNFPNFAIRNVSSSLASQMIAQI